MKFHCQKCDETKNTKDMVDNIYAYGPGTSVCKQCYQIACDNPPPKEQTDE